MSKPARLRDAALLLLPALALGGAALWMQNRATLRPARDESGPFRLVLERVERQPATPRDVAYGYDTRVVVTLSHDGHRPSSWGKWYFWSADDVFVFEDGRRKQTRRALAMGREYSWANWEIDAASQTYKTVFLFRLAHRAAAAGALRCEFAPRADHSTSTGSLTLGGDRTLSFLVLNANEKALTPDIERHSPLSIRSVEVTPADTMLLKSQFHVRGVINSSEFIERGNQHHFVGSSYLTDEAGQRYTSNSTLAYRTPEGNAFDCEWLFRDAARIRKARRLTLHARISLGETWPADIRAVLWDKTAKPAKP